MSFIFDALKKSQSSRQRQSGPGTVSVETAPGTKQAHNWQAIVVGIVVLNLLVIAGFAWFITRDSNAQQARVSAPGSQGAPAVSTNTDAPRQQPESVSGLASKPYSGNARGEVRPLSAEVRDTTPAPASGDSTREVAVPPGVTPATVNLVEPTASESAGFLPTLAELKLDQRIELSPLHIDVHVYNENPQRRFVLINARKYKEGERLREGPLLEEIRRDGLVMYYRDQRFLVPRE